LANELAQGLTDQSGETRANLAYSLQRVQLWPKTDALKTFFAVKLRLTGNVSQNFLVAPNSAMT